MLSLIEIDRKHDLAYILLQPDLRDRAGAVARSIQVGSDIVLDLDSNEQLVGIELLNASTRLDLSKIQEGVAGFQRHIDDIFAAGTLFNDDVGFTVRRGVTALQYLQITENSLFD